jgi:ATP-binding cassette subfamily B multidrug efflux pump
VHPPGGLSFEATAPGERERLLLLEEHAMLVLDERGTHVGLLAAGGAYARLYQAQFAQAMKEVA